MSAPPPATSTTQPPATLYVVINYGENEELLINPNCRQLIFMAYLRHKCQYDRNAFIDLVDENGKLADVQQVDPQENLAKIFTDRLTYIPCMLEKNVDDKSVPLKMVKPLLTDWEKKFPQLERKIKILTGESKRKRSPTKGLLGAGRGLEKRPSINRAEGAGRSSSIMGRPSSILNQSGRMSKTDSKLGRKSITGKAEKTDVGKGKKKKKYNV